MTKNQLIELVSSQLIKLDKNNRLHPEVVSKLISVAMNQLLYDTFRKVPTELDLMSKPYSLTIENGSAELPVTVYQLPESGQIRRFSMADNSVLTIVPEPLNGMSLYAHLDVGLIDTTPSFSLSGKTMTFNNLSDSITEITVWLIPSFDALEYDDTVYIPSGKSIDLYNIVSQLAGLSQPANLLNQ